MTSSGKADFARTNDGVDIAISVTGQGRPVVMLLPPPFSHIDFERNVPTLQPWFRAFAARRQLIRYDFRGCGKSSHVPAAYSLPALVSDLEAVADYLELSSFQIVALYHTAPVALLYAARHESRVDGLVLWGRPEYAAKLETDLVRERWPTDLKSLIRESAEPDVRTAINAELLRFSIDEIPEIATTTLVLKPENAWGSDARWADAVKSRLRNAHVALIGSETVNGEEPPPGMSSAFAGWLAIDEFAGRDPNAEFNYVYWPPSGRWGWRSGEMSRRTLQVMQLWVSGMNENDIVEALDVIGGQEVVRTRLKHVRRHLGVRGWRQGKIRAIELGYMEP